MGWFGSCFFVASVERIHNNRDKLFSNLSGLVGCPWHDSMGQLEFPADDRTCQIGKHGLAVILTKSGKYVVIVSQKSADKVQRFSSKLANLASSRVFFIWLPWHIVRPELTPGSLLMSSLSNYLRNHRKKSALSQEEVAFLLGGIGESKASRISRYESCSREPSLAAALAYEVIYGKPVRELFAGLYEQVQLDVAKRAKILGYRKRGLDAKRHETLINLVSKVTN
jgi:transcriptional regulator with XRE-family HTH domain